MKVVSGEKPERIVHNIMNIQFNNSWKAFPKIAEVLRYDSFIFNFFEETLCCIGCTSLHFQQSPQGALSFLHILANTCYLLSFDGYHSDKCEVIAHHLFDLYSPDC